MPIWNRIEGYLASEPWQVLFELAVIWCVVFLIVRFLRGTRGARVVWGVALILMGGTLILRIFGGGGDTLERLNFLYSNFLAFISLVLVIVFQPELRRALVRIGEAGFFRQSGIRKAKVVEEIVASVDYLSRNKIGALIAIERQTGLKGIVESGTRIDAEVSQQLLNTIFWPGSALHDLGVVVRGSRVLAAGVQFPIGDGEGVDPELGSRHRSAIGLSHEADALVLVVSEETGTISIAERGELSRGLSISDLRKTIAKGMTQVELDERSIAEDEPDAEKQAETPEEDTETPPSEKAG